ncbi:MAG: hypothetical protein LBC84_10480 [Prevotellaceae bacterium]|jgi:hypothetical protein|nr:hypothetical protein [Prevotellaceae bacterium]
MAKQCAICGVQMNVFQSQQLSDGNYICRKTCQKLGLKYLNYGKSSVEQVIAHNAQVARGTKLWEHYFVPRKKTSDKSKKLKKFSTIYVAEDIGLMALVEKRYKFMFWGKSEHVCVYRIADLYKYDKISIIASVVNGKKKNEFYINFRFPNVEGLSNFQIKFSSSSTCNNIIKYFDTLYGIQTTLGNFTKQMTNQIAAMKSAGSVAKSMLTGKVKDISDNQLQEAIDTTSVALYGDRTQWIEKADAALKEFDHSIQ